MSGFPAGDSGRELILHGAKSRILSRWHRLIITKAGKIVIPGPIEPGLANRYV